MTTNEKEVQCNVHGLITLTPFAIKSINTLIYKRLKGLKQLGNMNERFVVVKSKSNWFSGNTHEVYPTAVHTRFEHCLGVYHLGKIAI